MSLLVHSEDSKLVLDAPDTDVNEDVLRLLGAEEWEGVSVGFLLAKVRYSEVVVE